ncbi:MAG: RNA polymerase sigma-70 factor [Balneolaceae bacterium]|nr:RNA polymerase sigma-70 factor [Balneolaceae bacterium]
MTLSDNYEHTDQELAWIDKIRQGDNAAFERLFKRYYLQLTRFSWRYVNSRAVAEELVQETFSEIWEERETINIDRSVRSWLYKAVKNRSLNYIKHQKVQQKYDSRWMERKEADSTFDFEEKEHIERIRRQVKIAIEELPERSRMTYKLHRYDGLTYREIADVMDVSVKTVESQMSRTLRKLRDRLSHLLPLLVTAVMAAFGQ